MSPLPLFAAASMTALASQVPSAGESVGGVVLHRPPPSIHHLFAPGQKSVTRLQQFAIAPELFRSLPLHPNSNPPRGLPPPVPHRNPTMKLNPTYALVVSYDGTAFPGGYEKNPNLDVPTVQGVLSERISSAIGLDPLTRGIKLATSGRTDALVSAKASMMTFHVKEEIAASFLEDVNGLSVDADVTVRSATPVHASFHASFGGTSAREYLYVLPLLPHGAVLDDGEGNMSTYDCEEEYAVRLAEAANVLLSDVVGEEMDYLGMMKGKVKTQTTLCTILDAGCWYYDGDGNMLVGGEEGRPYEDVAPSFGECWREVRGRMSQCNDGVGSDSGVAGDVFPGWAGCLVFRVKSDRFLRRMMRKVVNSLLQEATFIVKADMDRVGGGANDWKGKWRQRVERQDRSGNTPALPQGLCFWRVEVE